MRYSMDHEVGSAAAASALQRALACDDLESANRLVIGRWFDLFRHHPDDVRIALSAVPARRLREYPLLAFLLGVICYGSSLRRATAMQYFRLGTRAAEERASAMSLPERILIHVAQSAALRLSGRVGMALYPARRALALLDDGLEELESTGEIVRVYAQLGRTFIEAGLRQEALDALARGAAAAAQRGLSGYPCLTLMAGTEALEGHLAAARHYLAAAADGDDALMAPYTSTFHHMATSILAMERGDDETASRHLGAIRPHRATTEHWLAIARVESYLGVVRRRPAEALARLDRIPQLRQADGRTRAARRELASLTALLQLALGRPYVASALLRRFGDPEAKVDRARIALATDEVHTALELIRATAGADLSLRKRTEATAIEAAANLRLPAPHRCPAIVHLLGARLRDTGMRLPSRCCPTAITRPS